MTREQATKIFRKEIECMSHSKCEDCILEKVCDPMRTTPLDSEYIEAYEMAIKALEQEPKTGHWIECDGWDGDVYYECSVCSEPFVLIDGTPTDNLYNYCPNCGAKMVEPQERSEE